MKFKEWFDEDAHDLYNYPEEAMEAAWNAALKSASENVNQLCLHHNTVVCAVNVINRNRTDT